MSILSSAPLRCRRALMLYLLDANVLITANSSYYPITQVAEFWSWLQHQAASGRVKIPFEILQEVLAGRPNEQLIDWLSVNENRAALTLSQTARSESGTTCSYKRLMRMI